MNRDAILRLIENLKAPRIRHYQGTWLSDHSDVLVISHGDRWSCATSGCAAGFTFLEEAEEGSVFDSTTEQVFSSMKQYSAWCASNLREPRPGAAASCTERSEDGVLMFDWARDKLGFTDKQAMWVFMDFTCDTDNTINKLRFLLQAEDISLYVSGMKY